MDLSLCGLACCCGFLQSVSRKKHMSALFAETAILSVLCVFRTTFCCNLDRSFSSSRTLWQSHAVSHRSENIQNRAIMEKRKSLDCDWLHPELLVYTELQLHAPAPHLKHPVSTNQALQDVGHCSAVPRLDTSMLRRLGIAKLYDLSWNMTPVMQLSRC